MTNHYYRWGFELVGDTLIEALSWHPMGPDAAIMRDEVDDQPPQFSWTSRHFNDLEPGSALAGRALALKELFDGGLYLVYGSRYQPDRLGDLLDFANDRRAGFYGPLPGQDPFSATYSAEPLEPGDESMVQEDLFAAALFLARTDGVVRGMLQTLGAGRITFRSLYALRDFMKTHGSKDAWIAKVGGCSPAELKRFTHTANNFGAIGTAAGTG